VEDHFVIKHEVRRKLLAGQKRRSYLKSRAAPGAYEGMVKGSNAIKKQLKPLWGRLLKEMNEQ
ncbi:hypothetical protein ACB288_20385, partial [Aeromonas taiwanensis]